MTEHPPSSQRLVFAISTIKGKPAVPVNFAPAFTPLSPSNREP